MENKVRKVFFVIFIFCTFFCGYSEKANAEIFSPKESLHLTDNTTASKKWKGKVLILWVGFGEYAWTKRLENACKRMGWECQISLDPLYYSYYDQIIEKNRPESFYLKSLIETWEPDCIINIKWDMLEWDGTYSKRVPCYVANQGSIARRCGEEVHSIDWYPSCSATEYDAVVPKTLFVSGCQWDAKRNKTEYQNLFSLLDQQGHLDIYGPAERWSCAPNSVRGMTFDEEEFRQAMRKSGIVLIVHTEYNFVYKDPSARIFEAASASCVIISDRQPFIVKEFGDSVLYIDSDISGEELFSQVEMHYQWILTHPEESEMMARKAHSIFSEKFTLEKHLEDFKKFHLEISQVL